MGMRRITAQIAAAAASPWGGAFRSGIRLTTGGGLAARTPWSLDAHGEGGLAANGGELIVGDTVLRRARARFQPRGGACLATWATHRRANPPTRSAPREGRVSPRDQPASAWGVPIPRNIPESSGKTPHGHRSPRSPAGSAPRGLRRLPSLRDRAAPSRARSRVLAPVPPTRGERPRRGGQKSGYPMQLPSLMMRLRLM